MIKLIATDMDGSLLPDDKKIPAEFWAMFQNLQKRDILFAAASGRPYPTLLHDFKSVADDMLFIAENGTLVMWKDEIIHLDALDHDLATGIIEYSQKNVKAPILLSGVKSAYVEPTNDAVMEQAHHFCKELEIVDDLRKVDDQIIKIAYCDLDGAETNCYPILKQFEDRASVVLSGHIWVDIMSKTASKGSAMKKVLEKFGIHRSEAMVFGDYHNDLDMFEVVDHSYAMANAHPDIKARAKFATVHSNNNSGVIKTIQDIVLI